MRILLLTQNFPPETGAVASRIYELAVRLEQHGAEITILAPLPNYPAMRVFEGYRRRWSMSERMDGLNVVRSYIYVVPTRRIARRILSYMSFVVSSMVTGLTRRGRYDFVFLDAPPLFLGISAYVIKLVKGRRLIVNMSDLWPESAEKLGLVRSRWLLGMARRLEDFLYRKADLITAQTQGIVRTITGRHPDKPVMWLRNGVDLSFFDPDRTVSSWREEHGFGASDFILLFAGLIGHAQGCEVIVRAAAELRDLNDVHFCLLGDGPEKQRCIDLSRELDLARVHFYGVQPKQAIPAVIAATDASIIPLKKLELFKGAIPSKIFEHLAMRKPILLGLEGEAKQLFVDEARAGLAYEPGNHEDLADKIRTLYADRDLCRELGDNGLRYVARQFNRDRIAEELWRFMQAAAAPSQA